ncbi:MAG TPA: 6,7-dimethyl-8-ribityllumazine synthase [Dictyobacter sp.]|nr:6,7-dimethyl-8-ribityllumazine synthase [Dictyobacter sp.]
MPDFVSPPPINLNGVGLRIGIVVARYNWHITGAVLALANTTLIDQGVKKDAIQIVSVPGSYELAPMAKKLLEHQRFDALICIGCIMKGETYHDVLVGNAAAYGIQRLGMDTGVPVIFGVICAETQQQAEARITRGQEYACAAIELAHTTNTLNSTQEANLV